MSCSIWVLREKEIRKIRCYLGSRERKLYKMYQEYRNCRRPRAIQAGVKIRASVRKGG